jgi:hypothetical protein
LIDLVAMYFRVEVEHMDQPQLLTGQDRTYFASNRPSCRAWIEPEQSDGDRHLSYAF